MNHMGARSLRKPLRDGFLMLFVDYATMFLAHQESILSLGRTVILLFFVETLMTMGKKEREKRKCASRV